MTSYECGRGAAALILACVATAHAANSQRLAAARGPSLAQKLERPLPAPREESAAAALGNRLYLIGGFDAAGNDRPEVFVFDGQRWRLGPALPVPLDHASAAVLDGRLYVAGGFSGGAVSARVFDLSSSERAWLTVASMHHARGAEALVPAGHALYALGGKDGAGIEIPAGEVYSPATRRWRDTRPLPLPRDHVAGFAYQGWACVSGGRSPNTARVDCYEPARGVWRRLPDLPLPTSGAGAATLRGQVVVGGGEIASEGGTVISQLVRFTGGRWIEDRMLIPRHGFEFAVYRGRIWACGGGVAPGLHPTAACSSIG